MNNFPLVLLLCLGALVFVVVGSYAVTPSTGGARVAHICATDSSVCGNRQ